MRFRDLPFLRLTLPLCAGVIMAEYVPQAALPALIAAVAALPVMALRLPGRPIRPDALYGAALIIFFISAGSLLRILEHKRPGELAGHRQLITLRLSEYPSRSSSGCSVKGPIVSVNGVGRASHRRGSMLLWFIGDTIPQRWQPGDLLTVWLRPVAVTNNGNPCEFNYRRHLESKGIRYMAFIRADDIVSHAAGSRLSLTERAAVAAHSVTGLYRRAGLQGDALGLVTALTLGDKELLDRDQLTTFSRSGVMHIMAVSGLHVGMISMALGWMLFFLRGRLRWVRSLLIIPALWGFAFITGLSPSVMRATIMFTFLQAGHLLNRPSAGMNNLLASAFIIITLNPSVLFAAGFQLSYVAVAFIITFYTRLHRLVRSANPVADYLWQIAVLSVVAQAGTLALTVRLFNIFPLLFLPANLVVIPVSFAIVMLSLLLLMVSPLPALASLLAHLLEWLARFTLSFTSVISSAGHGVLTGIGLSTAETILLTLTMALLLATLLHRRPVTLRPLLAALLMLLACNTVKAVHEGSRDRVITYRTRAGEVTVRQYGRLLLLPESTEEKERPPGKEEGDEEGNGTRGIRGRQRADETIPAEIRRHAATRGLKIIKTSPG